MVILWNFSFSQQAGVPISIGQLALDIKADVVKEVRVDGSGQKLTISYKDENREAAQSQIDGNVSLEELLSYYGVTAADYGPDGTEIIHEQSGQFGNALGYVLAFLPVILIIGFFYFMFRQAQGTNNQALAFGKSRARMFTGDHPAVTFDDVAGADEAKEELREVVDFLKEPDKFVSFGARIPKGVLLVGAPGTGKTLLAKAVSGEAGVPFFSIAGSEFVEMFVGVGASRVRDLFDQAKQHSPCIVFVDEIDAVGRHRGAGLGGSHDEREQTLNQILVEMDGFSTDTHVIILAATNRPDILDPALMRPGRFDRRVVIDRPDVKGREAIFRVHMRGKPIAKDVSVTVVARATPGFAGADIENTVNEAALLAARRNRPNIGMAEFQEAIERVQLGPERRSRVISPEEREITAYHEAGHALVGHFMAHTNELRKITIIPRGMTGGVTWFLDDDQTIMSESKFRAAIAVALGGRIAEEVVLGEVTTGAGNDLQQVTKLAQAMVTQYGMSHAMGLRVYGERHEMVFLGREISEQRDYSDAVAEQIDIEVRRIIDKAYSDARDILVNHRDLLDRIAHRLLEVETLEAEEFVALVEGANAGAAPTPVPPSPAAAPQTAGASGGRSKRRPTLDLPPTPSSASGRVKTLRRRHKRVSARLIA